MKIKQARTYVSAIAVAAIVLSAGAFYTFNPTTDRSVVYAYTSPVNQQDPATAPDSYKINFTDNNLKQALNKALRDQLSDPTRPLDSDITAGEAKQVSSLQGPRTLDKSNITNLEGLQYFVNLKLAGINENQIANLAPIADLPLLDDLRLNDNPNITDISPLKNLPKLKKLQFGRNKVTDFSALSAAPMLEELQINSVQGTLNLASLSGLNKVKFLNLNGNRLKSDSFGPIKNLPLLSKITIGGNSVVDLQEMLKNGFNHLGNGTQLNNQYYSTQKLALNQTLFPNPLKTPDGKTVPVNETTKIKNANADGTLNPNGDHIKLMVENFADSDFGDNKKLETSWDTRFNHGNMTNQQFHGKSFVINYNIKKDTTPPTITPNQPAKIVSRKGKTINLSDVTAEDNEGGSGLKSLTNNAVAQGLDVNNPAKGDYTITHTATDNQNNTATVTRQVEITDADDLQQAINQATTELTKGYTLSTKEKVTKKKQAAEAIIAQNDATQAQIDQALAELVKAINKLEVDTWKLVAAVTNKYNKAPDYIQQDPAVQTALAEANNVLNDPNKTPEAVDTAANNLINALNQAQQAEIDRQTEAANALSQIEGDDKKANRTPNTIQDVKTKIHAIKDGTKRNSLLKKFQPIEKAYNDQKNALAELIINAKKPETTAGMTAATVAQLQIAIQNAETTNSNTNASQEALETAINNLQAAINNLRADKTELETLINSIPGEPDYVKNDPEVIAKLAEANNVKNNPTATVDQVKQAKNALEKAVNDAKAAEVERLAELQRQADALQAIVDAEADKTPAKMDAAQAKIDAVKNETKKQELQGRLDVARQAYKLKKDELKKLLDKTNDPALLDGMTTDTANEVKTKSKAAKDNVYDNDAASQNEIELAIQTVQQAIDGLRADKKPLADAEDVYDEQPDYIKNNPAVAAALDRVHNTSNNSNPSVQQVRDDANALRDAINQARQAENSAQQALQSALQDAEDKLNAQMAPDAMPQINLQDLEDKLAKINDPARRDEFAGKLNTIKARFTNRQRQVDEYKNSEEYKRAEAAKKIKRSPKSSGLADTGTSVVAPALGGLGAVLAGVWTLLGRKRR